MRELLWNGWRRLGLWCRGRQLEVRSTEYLHTPYSAGAAVPGGLTWVLQLAQEGGKRRVDSPNQRSLHPGPREAGKSGLISGLTGARSTRDVPATAGLILIGRCGGKTCHSLAEASDCDRG